MTRAAQHSIGQQASPRGSRSAGTAGLIVMVGLLIGVGFYQASQRTVLIDGERREPVTSVPDLRLNLNQATVAELMALPGLGPRLAQRIVDDREANGPFASVDDLQRVSGIGPSIVDRIRPHVLVDGALRRSDGAN